MVAKPLSKLDVSERIVWKLSYTILIGFSYIVILFLCYYFPAYEISFGVKFVDLGVSFEYIKVSSGIRKIQVEIHIIKQWFKNDFCNVGDINSYIDFFRIQRR